MEKRAIVFFFLGYLVVATNIAEARIGEGYRQCVARYGNSYKNYPGLSHLFGVAVFEKEGINVAVAFDNPNKQGFLVLYTGGCFLSRRGRNAASNLKDNEIDSLMASLNVTWESTDCEQPKRNPPVTHKRNQRHSGFSFDKDIGFGSSPKSFTLSTSKAKECSSAPNLPVWTENIILAKEAVKNFVEAITLEKLSDDNGRCFYDRAKVVFSNPDFFVRPNDQYLLTPYRRSGDNLFAFKLFVGGNCYGLALINSDAATDISSWADAYQKANEKAPPEDKGRKLQGF